MCKSKAIQKRIDDLRKKIREDIELPQPWKAEQRLAARIGELMAAISEQAELSTRRIVRLTFGLLVLTAALLDFTVYLYKDTHALIHREQTGSPQLEKHP